MKRFALALACITLLVLACDLASVPTQPAPTPEPTVRPAQTATPIRIAPSATLPITLASTRTIAPTQTLRSSTAIPTAPKPASTATAAPKLPTPASNPTIPSSGVRIGAICKDGTRSTATGSGACSGHGGVAEWLYR